MLDWHTILYLQKTISYATIIFLIIAAYHDIKTFRIPNRIIICIGLLGILRLALLHDPISIIFAIVMVSLIFGTSLLLFSRGTIGGGDVKLLMAIALLIRYPDYYEFFVLMAVFGALLSIMMIVLRHYAIFLGSRVAASVATTSRLAVPYGVAIAGAGIVTLLMQPMLFRYSFSLAPSFLW